MNKLKYLGYSIVFQEVPNEVSLAINISGCPHKCEGCHSKYLWEYNGNYIADDLVKLIEQYKSLITCVCFMGGDQCEQDLIYCLNVIKTYGLKTCLYSGADEVNSNIQNHLDYLKIGHYDKLLGGLDQQTTNQRMYCYTNDKWEDITYLFQKRG